MSKDKMVTLLERLWPVIMFIVTTIAGGFVAWDNVKSDVRNVRTKVDYHEEQIKDLKSNNASFIAEMREGFRRNQESIEKVYGMMLSLHKEHGK